jgi:hypothetical protein
MKKIKIRPLPAVPGEPTPLTVEELKSYDLVPQEQEEAQGRFIPLTKEQLDVAMGLKRLQELGQDIELRKKYANRAFWICVIWLVCILLILLFQGFGVHWFDFKLAEPVILGLIGGTSVNVVGLFYFVMKYLFDPKRGLK